MNHEDFVSKLQNLKACERAVYFVIEHEYNMKQAWNNCVRADWMLWLICRMEIGTKRERIHIICDCAATVLRYIPEEDDKPRLVIKAVREYADNPTNENLKRLNTVRAAAWAVVGDAARSAEWAATWVITWAAARAASWAAAWDAVGAAMRAAEDAGWVAEAAAKSTSHKKMCEMIRKKINIS